MIHYRSALPLFAALAAVVLFARLGVWQLHRADEAKTLERTRAAQAQARPVPLDAAALAGDPAALRWRPVEARGVWDGSRQILLDNQVSDGVAGYLVYAPLHIPGCDCAVLVNRGWVPAGPRRDVAPEVGFAVATTTTIRGVAALASASGFGVQAGPGERLGDSLLRVQRLDAAEISAWLGVRVVPLTVLLAPDEPDGFRRDWHAPEGRADRHIAYASQWFLFALIAAGVALRLNSRRT